MWIASLLLAAVQTSTTPGVADLERVLEAHPSADLALAVAGFYDQDAEQRCAQGLEAYKRFFALCERCEILSYGIVRFERLLTECEFSIDEELEIRLAVSIPVTRSPRRLPGDATPREVATLFQKSRRIDERAAVRGLLELSILGPTLTSGDLNRLRTSGWALLERGGVRMEQVQELVERVRTVSPETHATLAEELEGTATSSKPVDLREMKRRALAALDEQSTAQPRIAWSQPKCDIRERREWGALTIDTRPWSRVFVNGVFIGESPIAKTPVLAGCVTVRAEHEDGRASVGTVTIEPNRTTRLRMGLPTEKGDAFMGM